MSELRVALVAEGPTDAIVCTLNGWCMETILFDTWDKVKNRDWKTHKENGTKAL